MTSTRDSLLTFLSLISQDTPDAVREASDIFEKSPEIGALYAEQSPKFVEIFGILSQGASRSETAGTLLKIVSMLFDCCFKNTAVYFGQLHYLADTIIRRYIPDLFVFLSRKQNKYAMNLFYQSAKVHHTHCRELFAALDFSSHVFRKQSKHDSGARDEYVKLATLFLENPEVSPSFLGTKYYLASIWKDLKDDEPETIRSFLTALINNISKANLSTRCWVFSDLTLKNLAKFPLEPNADGKDPKSLVYNLFDLLISGPESIILDDPKRCYCIAIPNIDPAPKNLNFLQFVRELDPWKKPGHKETALLIFKQSPDLISHFFSRVNRCITDEVTLANLSSLYFVNSVVDLPWPEFLYSDEHFYEENRQLDLLFESILPAFVESNKLTATLKSTKSVIISKAIIVLLISALHKFKTLPSFLKTPAAYAKLNSRIPQLDSVFDTKSPTLLSFGIKLLLELDNAIPFYLQDNQFRLPKLIKDIQKQEPLIQLQLIRIAGRMKKPVSYILPLSEIVQDESKNMILREEALKQIIGIVSTSGVFDNFEKEVPAWVAFSLRNNLVQQLMEKINDVSSKAHLFAQGGLGSLLCNAVCGKPLEQALPVISRVHHISVNELVSENKTITVSTDIPNIATILTGFKWYSVSECIVDLCSLDPTPVTLSAITAILIMCPKQSVEQILNSSLRGFAFVGNEDVDKLFSLAIEINGSLDDDLMVQFLNGTTSAEVIEKISEYIDFKFVVPMIEKMLKAHLPIRKILSTKETFDLSNQDMFWKWVFDGFSPINIELLSQVSDHTLHKIRNEELMLDILRTIYLKHDEPLVQRLRIRSTDNERIHALVAEMLPDAELPLDLPTCYVHHLEVPDLLTVFETTKHEWALEFLVRQIALKPFERQITRMRHERTAYVLKVYMEDYSESLGKTFAGRMLSFITKHPEAVTKTPTDVLDLYTQAAPIITEPNNLVNYNVEELKGVCNILNGADVLVTLRVILYLGVYLSDYDPFYSLIKVQEVQPENVLFVTGEASRFAIQQIISKQMIYPSNLSRNVSYLQPFHMSHTLATDTPRFCFLLYFANYLFTYRIITPEIFLESGAISIVFRALSSRDEATRELAYDTINDLYFENGEREWNKQNTIRAFLEAFVNSTTEENMRYSHLQTHFLAAFASVLMKPSHNLYMRIIKYITGTPSLRLNQVPLFDAVFDKPTVQYRAERNYILKMLQKGIAEVEDIPLLQHGRICERLMHVFSSPLSDMVTRKQIIEILSKVSALDRVEGIFGWILSVISEFFSAPHVVSLFQLAVNAIKTTDLDEFAFKKICGLVLSVPQLTETLSQSDIQKAKELIQ